MNKNTNPRNAVTNRLQNWTMLLLAGLFVLSPGAQAASLGLTLNDTPDIVSTFIDVKYNSEMGTLMASGTANELDDDGSPEAITAGSFDLTAMIDALGVMSSGTLSIGGTIASLGFNSGTLLTGTLTTFGFPEAGGDPLGFLFDVTGGDAASLYGSGAYPGGIILGSSGFTGSFTENFGRIDGVADVASVPIPAAVWLFGSALLGLVGLSRRRNT